MNRYERREHHLVRAVTFSFVRILRPGMSGLVPKANSDDTDTICVSPTSGGELSCTGRRCGFSGRRCRSVSAVSRGVTPDVSPNCVMAARSRRAAFNRTAQPRGRRGGSSSGRATRG